MDSHSCARCRATSEPQHSRILTQIPDRHVDGSYEIDLTLGIIVDAIVTQTQYFGAHALPPNQSDGSMAAIG